MTENISEIAKGADRAVWSFLVDRELSFLDRFEAGIQSAVTTWLDSHADQIVEAVAARMNAVDAVAQPSVSPSTGAGLGAEDAGYVPVEPEEGSWVYLIGSADHHHVKIGTTDNVARRLGELQTGSPIQLQVLWTAQGGRKLEKALHRAFAGQRKHGEWFDLAGHDPVELVSHVASEMGVRFAAPENELVRAERLLLASMLRTPGQVEMVIRARDLIEGDFSDPRNALIFRTMLALVDRDENATASMVVYELRQAGTLDEAGGVQYLERLGMLKIKGNATLTYASELRQAQADARFDAGDETP